MQTFEQDSTSELFILDPLERTGLGTVSAVSAVDMAWENGI